MLPDESEPLSALTEGCASLEASDQRLIIERQLMDVFAFREELITEYRRFSRSITNIRADDISREVASAHCAGDLWPEPPVQLNPNFEPDGWIDNLVDNGTIATECVKIFRLKHVDDTVGELLPLHRHQGDAISIAAHRKARCSPLAPVWASRWPTHYPHHRRCASAQAQGPVRGTLRDGTDLALAPKGHPLSKVHEL